MDRLPALTLASLLAIGCDDGAPARPLPSRVEAVAASNDEVASDLCDSTPGIPFALPALTSGAAPRVTGALWVNVWATWCMPCIEELPRLVRFQSRMRAERMNVDLLFVSADTSDEMVAEQRRLHPDTPASLRLASPDEVATWGSTLGLHNPSLPLHVLVDAHGRVRCARAASIGDDDYARVSALVAQIDGP